MPKFPEPPPPADLCRLEPELRRLPAGTELWRLYARGGRHPTRWNVFRSAGPTSARFDHQAAGAGDRAILYAAAEGPTCLAEVYQDSRVIDRTARQPWLVSFRLAEELVLLDLTGTWPTRAGASMVIQSGPRPRARRWSRAVYEAYPEVQGVHYASSMRANRPCVALWERARAALPEAPTFHRPLDDPALLIPLRNAAADLGYGLV